MNKKELFLKSFPLLTATGIVFALLLCMLTSAMIYISVPQTAPLIELLLSNNNPQPGTNSQLASSPSATPFQPVQETTPGPLPTPTPIVTPIPTTTIPPAPAAETETTIEEELGDIPPYAYITGVFGSPQLYTLDCEAQAAVDWARFFGVRIDELEFIERFPQSDDPDEGFVGYVNGPMGQLPPSDYGVHAGPVADLLRDYGIQAKAVRDWDLDRIKYEIAAGRPVIVWIVNLPFDIDTHEYTASNGNTTTVARFEHTWIVTGYNMNVLTVVDSDWTYNVKTQTFLERWNSLGNQAIVYRGN